MYLAESEVLYEFRTTRFGLSDRNRSKSEVMGNSKTNGGFSYSGYSGNIFFDETIYPVLGHQKTYHRLSRWHWLIKIYRGDSIGLLISLFLKIL